MTNFLSRRDFLSRMGAAGAVLAVSPIWADDDKPYGDYRMGIQSYSLRNFPFEKAMEMTKDLGLHWAQAFPNHFPMNQSVEQREKTLALLKQFDIRLVAWGVQGFGKDEANNRKIFEFAKAVGLETMSADPTPDSFDNLDKLVEEFGINIAIHPHGPQHRWGKVETIQNAIKDHHKRIGICADTGHLARAGEDVVQTVHTFRDRVYDVHLKDMNAEKRDVPVGAGTLDIAGFFKALKAVKFKGMVALEYELTPNDPLPGIRQSLEFVRKTMKGL